MSSPNSKHDWALWFAGLGLPVFPCKGKRPVTPHGFKDATTDMTQITRWWSQNPNWNLGMPTGKVSKCFAVDCDGQQGIDQFVQLIAENGGIPKTPISATGGGGLHYLFQYPTDREVRNGSKVGGKMIDVRGEGGYIIVPPSSHESGRDYAWQVSLADTPFAIPPGWVLDLVTSKGKQSASPLGSEQWFASECGGLTFETAPGAPDGARHDMACRLAGAHLRHEPPQEVLRKGRPWAKRCTPPFDEEELARIIYDLALKDLSKAEGPSKSQTQVQCLLALAQQCEAFHTPSSEPYATIPAGSHCENWPVRSNRFRKWLQRAYYHQFRTAPNKESLNSAIEMVEAIAAHDGPELNIFIRVAEHNGKVYIDLCNADWQVVEVDAQGWRITQQCPVKFRRTKGMRSLPSPETGGSVALLRDFLNIRDEDWPLLAVWLVSALRAVGPFAILIFVAEQGSGKSTTGETLSRLIDPGEAALRSDPRSEHDLMIAANNTWLLIFDNLSSVKQWLSDALCRLSTGAALVTRQLYTDTDEIILAAMRPIILTSIADIATRSDLLDRAVIVMLPPIPDDRRLPESEYWSRFDNAAPKIFGSLLDAISCGLQNLPKVETPSLPRMADFARWGVAVEPGLLLLPGSFLAAYARNRNRANELALEATPISKAISDLLTNESRFEGTATELLSRLNQLATDETRDQKNWPKDARYLSMVLRRIAPNLRSTGIDVDERQTGGSNSRQLWLIRKSTES